MRNELIRKMVILGVCILLAMTPIQTVYSDDFNEDEPLTEIFTPEVLDYNNLKPPRIEAVAALVMDAESGRVLFEKNAYSRRAIASTTKIMTAIVAIEKGNLNDKVKVSKRAASIRGSTIKLKAGEELTLRELLYGLMIRSGNDAAIAVAEHIGGSVENFVAMMNDKARVLGLKDTSFKTPHGLDVNGHYSTAYELALITRYALRNPIFSRIVGTRSTSITNRDLFSTNEMLGSYPGADGVKTGYTGKAGRCLVTSATRNNMRIISVVLNCSSRAKRAQSSKSILDYAFNNYKSYKLLESNQLIGKIGVRKGKKDYVPVIAVEDIKLPLTQDEMDSIQK
ncbi:MAG: D-alanyl-D-alanine carboxypeptidase family protein, partial [Bacillota bacterium]